jgi:hypothetical protein
MTPRSLQGLVLAAPIVLAAVGCTRYEYEEEAFVQVDGAGTIRVSGSSEILESIAGRKLDSVETLAPLVIGDGVSLVSKRETERGHRRFFHVEARFDDWNDLCRGSWFQDRRCGLRIEENETELLFSFPTTRGTGAAIDPEAELAVRVHFPGTVRYQNARGDVERGNIVSWRRSARDYFSGAPHEIEARFDRESILSDALRILLLAVVLVVATVSIAIVLMVRKGRRQLRSD